ncbi:inactive hydroxysteroid dehydrogenase-like protein 1 [Aricia agestis]|uniref:inactive hydroxysteroid dehydrogenase-like protein 1 n=1 Tax=Aricia agestis TaxID=91739 RepID=UPI001C202155|nr:inactive hydroxysteroid dehydrogenase-like protein 1 [Aricia agestis]
MVRQAFLLWSMSYFKWDTQLKKRFGEWAVVTGSTDGIGKQYALQLAQRGLNVVLISTDPRKLRAVAEEIETKYLVTTKTIVADFSTGTKVYAHIEAELRDLAVGILVNNVGVLNEYPMRFCDAPLERLWEMVNVNVVTAVSMCRLLLPGMVSRNRGIVVNVSSAAGCQAMPLVGLYSSTKASIINFTMMLREEYADTDIRFDLVYPMFVSSNLTAFSESISKGDLFTPDAAAFAAQAVNAIGTIPDTTGYWSQALKMELLLLFPVWARIKICHSIMKSLQHEYIMKNDVKCRS